MGSGMGFAQIEFTSPVQPNLSVLRRMSFAPKDLCNAPAASMLQASCRGPSPRTKRGAQDDNVKNGAKLFGLKGWRFIALNVISVAELPLSCFHSVKSVA